ncbi:putative small lipoprotein YifL [Paenibacillus mucilaginosus]|uniref:LptM family lipoprotein n=1 Tax=Paenibacillus mucilaginosus TaxID=61624 RepID=UPI003D221451
MKTSVSTLLLILAAVSLTACGSKGNPGSLELKPGTYSVTSAKYEIPDDDYELTLKNHGEYDIAFADLYIVMDPSRTASTLEITQDSRNILYLSHPRDLVRVKEKKEKKSAKAKPAQPASTGSSSSSQSPVKTDKKEEKK